MKAVRSIVVALAMMTFLSGCTALSNFWDSFDAPPEMTSPCVGKEASPCGPKRTPDQQWLMDHQRINITV